MMSKSELFYPRLSAHLLETLGDPATSASRSSFQPVSDPAPRSRNSSPILLSHTFRFDFSGHGDSSGEFKYGGYDRMVGEIESARRMLEEKEGLRVKYLIGHSMAANAVLMYAAAHSTIPHIVSLSPRYDMSVDHRFTQPQLIRLIRDGRMPWKVRGKTHWIEIEDYRRRLQTDMSVVRHIDSGQVRTLLMHGTADEVIPFADALEIHRWMIGKHRDANQVNDSAKTSTSEEHAPLEHPHDDFLSDLSQELQYRTDALEYNIQLDAGRMESPLVPVDAPGMRANPHVFVPVFRGDHNYTKPKEPVAAERYMMQTIVEWIRAQASSTNGQDQATNAATEPKSAAAASPPPTQAAAPSSQAKL